MSLGTCTWMCVLRHSKASQKKTREYSLQKDPPLSMKSEALTLIKCNRRLDAEDQENNDISRIMHSHAKLRKANVIHVCMFD